MAWHLFNPEARVKLEMVIGDSFVVDVVLSLGEVNLERPCCRASSAAKGARPQNGRFLAPFIHRTIKSEQREMREWERVV